MQSYGDVSTLYTATKTQGQVMVTFYSSLAAGRAFTALQGRTVHGRELQVDFHFSQKDAQAGGSYNMSSKCHLPPTKHIIRQNQIAKNLVLDQLSSGLRGGVCAPLFSCCAASSLQEV